jgi:hypothetical protein
MNNLDKTCQLVKHRLLYGQMTMVRLLSEVQATCVCFGYDAVGSYLSIHNPEAYKYKQYCEQIFWTKSVN